MATMKDFLAFLRNLFAIFSIAKKIKASKRTWTKVEDFGASSSNNLEVFKKLQEDPKWGCFFHEFQKGELEVGRKFAEGGQALLYKAKMKCRDSKWGEDDWILKVFKKKISLQELQCQWPEGMLNHHVKRVGERELIPRYNCDIQCGTLLKDGRFAFVMQKEETDLHKLIEAAMTVRSNRNSGPFSEAMAGSYMQQIAHGMIWLHDHNIIHRDVKAANVLIRKVDGKYYCFVADYECSVGVIGTGFWRAPEILKVVKERKTMQRPELPVFTKEADVYAFGMTCYEILTGEIPFKDIPVYKYDVVLNGERPKVPDYVKDWAQELLRGCWESNPAARPSFEKILKLLTEILSRIEGGTIDKRKAYWSILITEMISMYNSEVQSTELGPYDCALDIESETQDVEIFKNLQTHPFFGNFFMTFGDGELVVGEKFAEGGQAEIYHAKVNWKNQFLCKDVLKKLSEYEIVFKVFKEGTHLRDLQSRLPLGMVEYVAKRIEHARSETTIGALMMYEEWEKQRYISNVLCGTLLADGRFAFLIEKQQEDLRSLIDRKMLWKIGEDCGPFPKKIAEELMHNIALGIAWLHAHNIVHRDLKASNVLVREDGDGYQCFVADYESSIGVVGTVFFRAPEILQACKEKTIGKRPELFTFAIDIYSYAMTCFEILTGKYPFEGHPKNDYDLVLKGQRPEVPEYVDSWAHGLLNGCWASNPGDRPSIHDILEEFELRKGSTSNEALDSR